MEVHIVELWKSSLKGLGVVISGSITWRLRVIQVGQRAQEHFVRIGSRRRGIGRYAFLPIFVHNFLSRSS
jgi:hypothetical protein